MYHYPKQDYTSPKTRPKIHDNTQKPIKKLRKQKWGLEVLVGWQQRTNISITSPSILSVIPFVLKSLPLISCISPINSNSCFSSSRDVLKIYQVRRHQGFFMSSYGSYCSGTLEKQNWKLQPSKAAHMSNSPPIYVQIFEQINIFIDSRRGSVVRVCDRGREREGGGGGREKIW